MTDAAPLKTLVDEVRTSRLHETPTQTYSERLEHVISHPECAADSEGARQAQRLKELFTPPPAPGAHWHAEVLEAARAVADKASGERSRLAQLLKMSQPDAARVAESVEALPDDHPQRAPGEALAKAMQREEYGEARGILSVFSARNFAAAGKTAPVSHEGHNHKGVLSHLIDEAPADTGPPVCLPADEPACCGGGPHHHEFDAVPHTHVQEHVHGPDCNHERPLVKAHAGAELERIKVIGGIAVGVGAANLLSSWLDRREISGRSDASSRSSGKHSR